MSEVTINPHFSKNASASDLKILTVGHGILDTGWHGSVIETPYSRFYFVLDGEFFIIGPSGEKMLFKKGFAYLIPSGYSYDFGCDTAMEHIYFHIQLCGFDNIDMLSACARPLSIPFELSSEKSELIAKALSNSLFDNFVIEALMRKTLCDMLIENGIVIMQNEYSKEINAAINYIKSNLSISISTADIANETHLSESTVTRRFRRELGMSIGEYIDRLIMFGAERDVSAGRMSILEISEKYGFCDQFYFSRRFKEKYGASPREYRKIKNV